MIKGCISVHRAWQLQDECYGDEDKIMDSLLKEPSDLKPYKTKGKGILYAMSRFVQIFPTLETQAGTGGLSEELNSRMMLSKRQKLPEEPRLGLYKSERDENTPNTLTGLVRRFYSQLLLLDRAKRVLAEFPTTYKNDKTARSTDEVSVNLHWKQTKGSRAAGGGGSG